MSASIAQTEIADVRDGLNADFRSQGEASTQDKVFAAADIIAAAIGLGVHSSIPYQSDQGAQVLKGLFDGKRGAADAAVKANPWFVANGHIDKIDGTDDDDVRSPVTQAYIRSRSWKSVGGTATSLVGSALSMKTAGLNVASAVRHGSAFMTTDAHLLGIWAIARSSRKTGTIAEWCEVVMRAKASKAAIRATQLAGAVIPVPLAGGLINIATAAGKIGRKIGYTEVCYMTAIEIHWRAFREQKVAGNQKSGWPLRTPIQSKPDMKVGPASRIFTELFTRRGVTAVFRKYDVASLISEPAGWMALGDKIARD